MNILYDYKMQGLLIEVTKEELQSVAKDICTKAGQMDLLENEIHHVTYTPTIPEDVEQKKAFWYIGLMLILWPGVLIVLVSGLYQIGKWIIDWFF